MINSKSELQKVNTSWHHVAIAVKDMKGMVAFFKDILGFVVDWDHEHRSGSMMDAVVGLENVDAHIVMLKGYGVQVELFHYWHPEGEDKIGRQCDFGMTHFCLSVNQIHMIYQELRNKGVTFNSPPQNLRDGVWATYMNGPEGLTIELVQYDQAG